MASQAEPDGRKRKKDWWGRIGEAIWTTMGIMKTDKSATSSLPPLDIDDPVLLSKGPSNITDHNHNDMLESQLASVKLDATPTQAGIPKHLAFIPDGDRRWARSRGLEPWKGHKVGGDILLTAVIPTVWNRGVHTVTVWGNSPQNLNRPSKEVDQLWAVIEDCVLQLEVICDEYEARFIHIGHTHRMPSSLLRLIRRLEDKTMRRTLRILNIGLDYSGIDEIVEAVRKVGKPSEVITEEDISRNLYTASRNQPYSQPDLIVRAGMKNVNTGRLSGFMVWQSSFAEILFVRKYMPDITAEDVEEWIKNYVASERTFGKHTHSAQ